MQALVKLIKMETQTVYSILSVLLSIALFKALSSLFKRSKNKAPPGPYPLPFVGNLFQIGDKPHKSLAKLAQIHGPLMSIRLGEIKTIVISSSTLVKHAFQTHDLIFSSRTVPQKLQTHDHHKVSMINLPLGPEWRNLRKISSVYLFSNQQLDANQHIRTNKIQQLLSYVDECSRSGKVIEIDQAAFRTTLSVLSAVMMSLDLDDSGSNRVKEYKELINHVAEESVKLDVLDFFPSLGYVFPQRIKGWLTIYIGRLFDLFDRIIDERLEARKEQKYVSTNDMLDSLLSLTEDNKEPIDRNSIKHLFMDLIIAGTDTTSSTFEWAMAEILRNPETIKKARAEIEKKIGRNQKMVHESDVAELPYLRAIVKETFRLHPAAPILIPRKTTEDIEIEGYFIPKDTQVIVNAWKIGRDPSLWENPEKFMPERFLESAVDPGGQHFELIPFGGGRRMCAGMPLAIRMLHSMLGSLIYRFDWKLEDGVKPENVDMNENSATIVHMATPLRAIPVQLNY